VLDFCARRRISLRAYVLGLLLVTTSAAQWMSASSTSALAVHNHVDNRQSTRSSRERKAASATENSQVLAAYGQIPLSFEANVGQTDPRVKFISRNKQFTLFLTPSEAVFAMPTLRRQTQRFDRSLGEHDQSATASKADGTQQESEKALAESVIRMRLVGASSNPALIGQRRAAGTKYYFIGNDPRNWHTSVPLFSRATYLDLYPGIDLTYRGENRQLEFDYIVKPRKDPGKISLEFEGERDIRIDPAGNLVLSSASGELRFHKPKAYQEDAEGGRQPVEARFVIEKHGAVGFALGRYDRHRQLVIDPSVVYATYLGGSSQDEGLGIALDVENNAYITGATMSVDFPTEPPGSLMGGFDVFVTKLDPAGNLLFSALYGGALGDDIGTSVAVSSSGISTGVYVAGSTTSADFPAFGGAQNFLAGTQNAFLLEIVSLTDQTQFVATFLGGSVSDTGTGVTFDANGYGYVVGKTTSPDFPSVNPLPGETQINLGRGSGPADGFVTEVAPGCTVFVFSSFLGGSKDDFASGVAINDQMSDSYNIYISGATDSPDFFTTPGVVQPTCGTDSNCNGGQDDGFVTSISYAAGVYSYNYSTYLGGSGTDKALSIAADSTGNAYLTGQTTSTDFPLKNAFQSSLKGVQNAFVAGLNPQATELLYSTYLGGSGTDSGLGIVIDSLNNAYVTGQTNSPDFPVLHPTQTTIGGGNDAFVSEFEPVAGGLTFSTFLGGSGDEDLVGGSIAVDSTQNVYVTGDTNSADFPTTPGAFQPGFAGSGTCVINGVMAPCEDAFIAKIDAQPPQNSTLTVELTGSGTATVTSSPDGIDCTFDTSPCSASFANGTIVTLSETTVGTTFNGWGGACSGTDACVVTLNSDETVTADFSINITNSTLVVNLSGNGSGTVTSVPPGIDCSPSNPGGCSATFSTGTVVTLTARADPGSTFAGWGDPCSGLGTCVITLNVPNFTTTVSATFTQSTDYSTLSVSLGGDGQGVVISTPTGINCPGTCSASFPDGTVVTLLAKATSGSIFIGWSGACSGTGSCVVIMNSDQSVTANFTSNGQDQTLSVTVNGTGTGTVTSSSPPGINCPGTCSITLPPGTVVTLVETPDSGSAFAGWSEDATPCGTATTCTITLNKTLVGVTATFNQSVAPPPPVNFTLAVSPTGNLVVSAGGSVAYGLNMLSLNGFTDTINLSCSVQPASGFPATCSLNPASVALGANQGASSTLTINAFSIIASLKSAPRGRSSSPLYALLVPFLGFALLAPYLRRTPSSRKKKRFRFSFGFLLLLFVLIGQVSCGGGGRSSSLGGISNAQPGNYTVTVTATGAITQATQTVVVSVNVQ